MFKSTQPCGKINCTCGHYCFGKPSFTKFPSYKRQCGDALGEKKCQKKKSRLINRCLLTQKQYDDMLSTPKPPPCIEPFPPKRYLPHSKLCSPRLDQLALPTNKLVLDVLANYHHRLGPERVVRLVKLIHDNKSLRPKIYISQRMKKFKGKKKKKSDKQRELEQARLWLCQQVELSATLIIKFLKTKPVFTPNYMQVLISLRCLRHIWPKRKKLRVYKHTRKNLLKICEQLAIIADSLCNPIKQQCLLYPKMSGVLDGDQKRKVSFEMNEDDADIIGEIVDIWEESEEEEEEEEELYEEGEGEGEGEEGMRGRPGEREGEGEDGIFVGGEWIPKDKEEDMFDLQEGEYPGDYMDGYGGLDGEKFPDGDLEPLLEEVGEGEGEQGAGEIGEGVRRGIGGVGGEEGAGGVLGEAGEDGAGGALDEDGALGEGGEGGEGGALGEGGEGGALDEGDKGAGGLSAAEEGEGGTEADGIAGADDTTGAAGGTEGTPGATGGVEGEAGIEGARDTEGGTGIEGVVEGDAADIEGGEADADGLGEDEEALLAEMEGEELGEESAEDQLWKDFHGHPPGTVSFLCWKIYCSWLEGFAKNIQTYGKCLRNFRQVFEEEDHKPVEVIKTILTDWSKYLTDCRTIDDKITAFFKDKPITKCPQCEGDYPLDKLPEYHEVPPELIAALQSTSKWKAMLDEAEKGCQALMQAKEESAASAESAGVFDFYEMSRTSRDQSSDSIIEVEEIDPNKQYMFMDERRKR